MKLHSQLGELRQLLLRSAHRRTTSFNLQMPVVSFCFDDFPRTAYSAGGAILKSFGARGTYYAALGLMNSTNELGDQLTAEDLDSVLSDGHELGCHTFTHCSVRRVSLDEFERDVLLGRDAIRKMTGCETANFSYPYGHVSVASKKRLGAHFHSCRGIYGGTNAKVVDLNLLRANSLYGDMDHFSTAESLLAENERRSGWLIFYTHDVRRNPSPFGCTPDLLGKVVERTLEKGFRIVLVGEMVDLALQPLTVTGTPNTGSPVEE